MNGPQLPVPVVRAVVALGVALFLCSWLAAPAPARAARLVTIARVAAMPFAEGDSWGIRRVFGGMSSRTRIIQIAVALMCLGLFILMRKFTI